MNDFGINLQNKRAVFKKAQFCLADADVAARTFLCEGGPGCEPDGGAFWRGLLFGPRTISGQWQSNSQRDTISSYDLEAYISDTGRLIPPKESGEPAGDVYDASEYPNVTMALVPLEEKAKLISVRRKR